MEKTQKQKIILIFSLLYYCHILQAQTPEKNLIKYWNYRDKFQKQFVLIGSNPGYGINFANIDNNPAHWSWVNPNDVTHGFRKTGDAMNDQGSYISVLATQYRLLKDGGKDVTSTLNELYYAINAVNRVDRRAENFFDDNLPDNLNGFMLRDDVDEDVAQVWIGQASISNDFRDLYEGISTNYYVDDDPNHTNYPFRNEMSQDQSIGLMQGFCYVLKYVDNVYVKPKSTDAGFYLHDEVKAIVNRFMNYIIQDYNSDFSFQVAQIPASSLNMVVNGTSLLFGGPIYPLPVSGTVNINSTSHVTENWVMVNPVFNTKVKSGSEMRLFSYAIAKTADIITGNNYVGTAPVRFHSSDILGDGQLGLTIPTITIPLNDVNSAWSPLQNMSWDPADITGWHFRVQIPGSYSLATNSYQYLKFDGFTTHDYNVNLSLLLATMSGSWSQNNVKRIADMWHMEIFDLMYATLNNTTPLHSQQYWENLLNSAPCVGPYNFKDNNGNFNYDPIWFDTNKWNGHTDATVSTTFGEFNGNDYMLLYNLYQLAYRNVAQLPEYSDNSCQCTSSPNIIQSGGVLTNSLTLNRRFPDYLDVQIALKEYLVEDLSVPNGNFLNVETDLVVCNNKTLLISGGGQVNVGSSTIENSSIIVRSGSTLHISGSALLSINNNCKVIIEKGGQIIIDPSAEIQLKGSNARLEVLDENINMDMATGSVKITKSIASQGGVMYLAGGHLFLRTGATLTNENCKIEIGRNMNFHFYPSAILQLKGDNAVLDFNGNLVIENNATFTFSYPGASSGYLRFSRPDYINAASPYNNPPNVIAGSNTFFDVQGTSKADKIIEIIQETLYLPANLSKIKITNGTVALGSDARLSPIGNNTELAFNNMRITSTTITRNNHRGLTLFGQAGPVNITNSTFENGKTGISAMLLYSGNPLVLTNDEFKNCNTGLYSQGSGVTLNNCNFNGNTGTVAINSGDNALSSSQNNSGWFANAMTSPCYINGGNIGGPYSNPGNTFGVYFLGTPSSLLTINNCSIRNNQYPVVINGATAKVKCTKLNANINGFHAMLGATLYMDNSIAATGSQSDFSGNNVSILTDRACMLYLDGGNNNFTSSIRGTLVGPPISGQNGCNLVTWNNISKIVKARSNKWNSNQNCQFADTDVMVYAKISAASNIYCNLNLSNNNYYNRIKFMDDATIAAVTTCGSSTPKCIPCTSPLCFIRSPIIDCPSCHIINTPDFAHIRRNEALKSVIADATSLKSRQVSQLYQVLTDNVGNPTKDEAYVVDYSYKKMNAEFAEGFITGELTSAQNNPNLSLPVLQMLEVQDKRIEEASANDDYYNLVFTGIEKAQTYRTAGRRDLALSILDNIITWVQPEESDRVSYWRCLINNEDQLLRGNLNLYDFEIAMNQCTANVYIDNRSMTIIKDDMESVESLKPKTSLLPNPNNGNMTLSYSLAKNESGSIIVYDIAGRFIVEYKLDNETNTMLIVNDELKNGIYLYNIIIDGKVISSDKIVIIK
jgi:hypothetical protein